MKAKYFFIFSMVAASFLSSRAQAQCAGWCETFATYDSGSGTITGYSYYENAYFGDSLIVESYIWDPNYNSTYLGSAVGMISVEKDFSYTPQIGGHFTVAGFNSYFDEDWG